MLTVCNMQIFSLKAPTVPKNEMMKIKIPTAISTAAGSVDMLENVLYEAFCVTAQKPIPIITPPIPYRLSKMLCNYKINFLFTVALLEKHKTKD